MKVTRKSISTRGRIAMFIVVIIGILYWLMGKIENWIGSLQDKRISKKEQ